MDIFLLLDEYYKEKKANYQPNSNRMAQVQKQDHGDEDPPENPEPYPMQDSDIEK